MMCSGPKVLVVDDEPDIVAICRINLELEGYDVVAACDGAEALNVLLAETSPDLVLLDLMMPRVDGWGVLDRLARDDSIEDVPVIVVSARTAEADRDRAAAMGAHDFLTKPFTTASLLRVVEEAVGTPTASTCC